MELKPGDQLGPFEILGLIGKGGMGEVYKARDPRLGRDVAIKVVAQQFSWRFEREARAIGALNHPNICQVYFVGPNYLVMEYIEGTPPRGPLPPAEAVHLALGIAAGLEAAHDKGVTHRDLKPANILVTKSGSQPGLKLLDFGLALIRDDEVPGVHEAVTGAVPEATVAGTVLGTAGYMSPEQVQAKPVDARSDIFSFGLVLYELLSGRRAFAGESVIDTMAAIVRDEPAPLDAPAKLVEIVTRCLRKAPTARFQTMSEIRAALDQVNAQINAVRADETPSIAVLPFANMSGDKEQEYFSDGLAEEILNLLAKIPGLKVTARTSSFAFRGKEQDIRKIAEALRARAILEGGVRRSGNRLRVTAQLIDAEDGYHLWSQRYDREMADVFDLQDEIAQAIVSALQVRLSGTPAPFEQYRPSLPAYEALLKARYYSGLFRPDLLPRAKECFEQAIALDPKFALAHCEYGSLFTLMAYVGALPAKEAFSMARSQAQTALDLDPSLSLGHAMLGFLAAHLEHDWKEAKRCFRLAMARDPVHVIVRMYYAVDYLLLTGRPAEAVQQIELGLQGDPLNFILRILRAGCLAAAGRDEEAAEGYREILELNPAMLGAQFALAAHHASRGELNQALAFCEKAYALALLPEPIGLLAGLLKRTGEVRRAEELLRKLEPSDAYGVPRGLAVYHWALREFGAAADWFEKAIDQHDPASLVLLRIWQRELRSTPRWAGLMRKLKLPES